MEPTHAKPFIAQYAETQTRKVSKFASGFAVSGSEKSFTSSKSESAERDLTL